VTFGAGNISEGEEARRNPDQIKKWFGRLHPELEENYVGSLWMDWNQNKFSRGTWAMCVTIAFTRAARRRALTVLSSRYGPEYYTKYFKELQKPHGNVLFASAGASPFSPPLHACCCSRSGGLLSSFDILLTFFSRLSSLSTPPTDWASGWKSFIDGACEQGTLHAYNILQEWKKRPQPARL
jgi:hypothetical protein